MEGLHTALSLLTGSAILLFEYTGVGVIIATGIMGIMRCLRRDPATRLQLANVSDSSEVKSSLQLKYKSNSLCSSGKSDFMNPSEPDSIY